MEYKELWMSEYGERETTPINGQKQEEESFTYFFSKLLKESEQINTASAEKKERKTERESEHAQTHTERREQNTKKKKR